MALPFGELGWENFERLCYQLARREGQIEDVQRYGRQGQAQGGIDVFARKPNGRYAVWQSKRYVSFGPANVRSAVGAFRKGAWLKRADTLFLAVQARLDDTALQDEIEAQAKVLAADGVTFVGLGGDGLADRLRHHPELVHAFFGRAWTKVFYGEAADAAVVATLDGPEFAKVRAQLGRVYLTRFQALDPGAIGSGFALDPTDAPPPLGLLQRYAIPDIVLRERRTDAPAALAPEPADQTSPDRPDTARAGPVSPRETMRRTSVADWLREGDQIAVVADAGAGKSTLLRCIALDLLGDQRVFPSLAGRWGGRLPIFISFAKWARVTATADSEVGLKDLVAAVLQPLLTVDLVPLVNRAIDEGRIILLVDGLDEWAAEQPARLAFQTMLTYTDAHGVPAIASGRPSGLRRIGALPQTWKVGELAPLSALQQRQLARTWFGHQHRQGRGHDAAESAAAWSADRFLNELKRDGALAELAANPLLFVGLLGLAMRQVALPRDRCQALDSLVQILLEVHPQSRATAAGDVRPRFEHAAPDVRRTAMGALAFASRRDGGDAGYPRDQAAAVIVAHLIDTVGIAAERARAAADEMLAINAETVGLLVEKAPGEIGFAHASLEEFLGAEHVQSWRLSALLDFAGEKAGDPRWRNVLRNMVALNRRPDEIDDIVSRLEAAQLNVVGDIERRRLLAEIAFGPSAMRSATAHRLAADVFAAIDRAGLATEQVTLARIALSGLASPTLGGVVADRVERWAPRRFRFGTNEFQALRRWPKGEDLLETLFAGLNDDEDWVKQAAADSLAARYAGDPEVGRRLRDLMSGAELGTVMAALEALVRGWSKSDLEDLLTAAAASPIARLRALALLGRVLRGAHGDAELDALYELLLSNAGPRFRENGVLGEALQRGWPDDPRVVARALRDVQRRHDPEAIDYDSALHYLLHASPDHPALRDWILAQLEEKHPFIGLLGESWGFLAPFAEADPRIHERVLSYVLERSEHWENRVWPLIAEIHDPRLRDHAIARASGTSGTTRYWSLLPLLRGWKDDPAVRSLLVEMRALPDDELDMVAALLPDLYDDPTEARAHLLRVARGAQKPRTDLLIRAFAQLGCDEQDEEVVEILLPRFAARAIFDDLGGLFLHFGDHPKVRALAIRELQGPRQPLAALAQAYGHDDEVRPLVRRRLTPASASLRYVIAEACAVDGDRHPALLAVLESFDAETDFDLRVQLVIYYSALRAAQGPAPDLEARLLAETERRGMDHEEARSTGFAGLVELGQVRLMDPPGDAGRRIRIQDPIGDAGSAALVRLIVERWDALEALLGQGWVDRWFDDGRDGVWHRLAPHLGGHPAARRAFLEWCDTAKSLGPAALRALAELDPGSDVLRRHVAAALTPPMPERRPPLITLIAAAEIARDQFPHPAWIGESEMRFERGRDGDTAVVLAILAPTHPALAGIEMTSVEIGQTFRGWLIGAYLAAWTEPADLVAHYVAAMAGRIAAASHENQDLMNRVLAARVGRDPALAAELNAVRTSGADLQSFCAAAQLLAAAGRREDAWRDDILGRLKAEHGQEGLPKIIFDTAADQYRPAAHVLLDILQTAGPT
ncbi:NACHT domain-containing protein [Phenylobacterium sp. LjRoot225]|uniref:NACHT domain-containing protein n=1 Tax=Phenylobacterium sp. LjRoot225 TaxID=3342285 RepID=UPI003F50B2F3